MVECEPQIGIHEVEAEGVVEWRGEVSGTQTVTFHVARTEG